MPGKAIDHNASLPSDLLSRYYHYGIKSAALAFILCQTVLFFTGTGGIENLESQYPFSAWARDINIFISGAFVSSAVLQITRITLSQTQKSCPWNPRASLTTTLTVNIIAAFSTLTTLSSRGRICVDAYG